MSDTKLSCGPIRYHGASAHILNRDGVCHCRCSRSGFVINSAWKEDLFANRATLDPHDACPASTWRIFASALCGIPCVPSVGSPPGRRCSSTCFVRVQAPETKSVVATLGAGACFVFLVLGTMLCHAFRQGFCRAPKSLQTKTHGAED